MKDQWVGANVDLNVLSERLENFFVENKFDTLRDQTASKFIILAKNDAFRVRVNVYGQPGDFTVEFIPSRKTQGFSVSMMLSYITSMFGGGSFLLWDLKLQEAVNFLERVFWKEVDFQVAELSSSTSATK